MKMHAPKTLKPLEAGVSTALLLSSGGLAQSKSINQGPAITSKRYLSRLLAGRSKRFSVWKTRTIIEFGNY